MNRVPTTEELWGVFWRHELDANTFSYPADHRLASATMANAIARIIVSREETNTYNMFRSRSSRTA